MDGSGGCCLARYAGNMYDMSKMDRIMLKYRPIAPKPTNNSSGSRSSTAENSGTYVKTGRGKRRYVRNSNNKNVENNGSETKRCKCKKSRKRKSASSEENDSNGRSAVSAGSVSGGDPVVTLPLLPETPDRKEYHESPGRGTSSGVEKVPLWLNFGSREFERHLDGTEVRVAQPVKVVGTWVKVECITETWVDGYGYGGVGCTDDEKLMNLERDTCPGFISDGANRVRWVNRAYREMVVGQEDEEVLVWLVMKEGLQLPPKNLPTFTCTVRVVTCGKEKTSLALPCDVWRLQGGQGFAWRLDTKAALSLGR